MPTCYTDALITKNLDFNAFVMLCARAMGATIMMREDSLDAPIPERFEPSDYNQKKLIEAYTRLGFLKDMKPAEGLQWARAELAKLIADCERSIAERDKEDRIGKYKAMLAKVEMWTPPTRDHIGLRDFMRQQLKDSIDFDHSDYYDKMLQELQSTTPELYLAEQMDSARSDIEYHRKAHAEEVERTESRNRWLKELRESLKGK